MTFKENSTFVARLPLLSFDNLKTILANHENLWQAFENPVIQEALYIASPSLYNELLKASKESNLSNEGIENSLIRYLVRMSTRCTPFGFFSGCLLGEIGYETNIKITETLRIKRRLDMSLLCRIHDELLNNTESKKVLKYFPNPTIYQISNKYRYIEIIDIHKGTRNISQIVKTTTLRSILKAAEDGITINELVLLLTTKGFEEIDCIDYIIDLIDNQILLDELYCPTTGKDYFSRIMEFNSNFTDHLQWCQLNKINDNLKSLNLNSKTNKISNYESLNNDIRNLNLSIVPEYLFQVDQFRDASLSMIGPKIINELHSTISFLNKLLPRKKNENISSFFEEFQLRYESQEIPLLEALDPEIGIGYPNSAIDQYNNSLIEDVKAIKKVEPKYNLYSNLEKEIYSSCQFNEMEVVLTDDLVKNIDEDWTGYFDTMAALFKIIKDNKKEVLISFKGFVGPSAANLLSRFSHCEDKLLNLVQSITSYEQLCEKNAIVAEIVDLAASRAGNILFRPHIRDYEIICGGSSDIDIDKKILANDLMISIRKNKLYLRSKKLNKQILPKLTTAHYYPLSKSPVYVFLCDLQKQDGICELDFTNILNPVGNHHKFVPRIRYRNTILSPARWFIQIEEIRTILNHKDLDLLISKLREWRNERSIPKHVLFRNNDSEFFIDLENKLSIRAIRSKLLAEEEILFSEFIFEQQDAIVNNNKGSYLNEIILPFFKS